MLLMRRRYSRQAATLLPWAGGLALCWLLAMTIWLPYIDKSKGYADVFNSLHVALPADMQRECIASARLGEPQRGLLEYYAGVVTQRVETGRGANCRYLLDQGFRDEEPNYGAGWRKIWEGGRPGGDKDRYRLYLNSPASSG